MGDKFVDIVQLRYFKEIAEHEHMTNAAQALHVVQPALSRTLRNLEKELGLLLFDRVGKNIVLNENGKILLTYANNILSQVDEAKRVLADRRDTSNSQVRLYMEAATGLLPVIIAGFRDIHPDISVVITQQKIGTNSKSDIQISATMQPLPENKGITLLREDICLAVPISNPLSKRKSIRLIEVANMPFVCLQKNTNLRIITETYCLDAGFVPKVAFESDSPQVVRDLIAKGVGIAFIPKQTWSTMEQDAGIALVEIESIECSRYIYMTTSEKQYVSSASKALQKYLVDFFAKLERK